MQDNRASSVYLRRTIADDLLLLDFPVFFDVTEMMTCGQHAVLLWSPWAAEISRYPRFAGFARRMEFPD